MNQTEYIAFFDLDGTLINANSGEALVRGAYERGMMSRYELFRALNLSILYRFKLRDTINIINDMVSWVKGVSEKEILDLASEITTSILIPAIFNEVIPELEAHRNRNGKVVILSSAVRPVCQLIGTYLHFDDVICSDLEVINGRYTGHSLGELCFAEEKAVRLIEYCEKNNTSPEKSWYYGDSEPDLFVMSIVGNPVCINPDKVLLKEAKHKNWTINKWH